MEPIGRYECLPSIDVGGDIQKLPLNSDNMAVEHRLFYKVQGSRSRPLEYRLRGITEQDPTSPGKVCLVSMPILRNH